MSWRMVSDSEVRQLALPDKMFAYAGAYLRGSTVRCTQLADPQSECTWADGAFVLMSSAHAVELFLKGMLLKRVPQQLVWARQHDLEGLTSDYHTHFPDPAFAWDIPFRREYPEGMSQEAVAQFGPPPDAPPSILYRYPVGKTGQDWKGLYGFEPNSFLPILSQLREDFARLRNVAA